MKTIEKYEELKKGGMKDYEIKKLLGESLIAVSFEGHCYGTARDIPEGGGSYPTTHWGGLDFFWRSPLKEGEIFEHNGKSFKVLKNTYHSGSPEWPATTNFVAVELGEYIPQKEPQGFKEHLEVIVKKIKEGKDVFAPLWNATYREALKDEKCLQDMKAENPLRIEVNNLLIMISYNGYQVKARVSLRGAAEGSWGLHSFASFQKWGADGIHLVDCNCSSEEELKLATQECYVLRKVMEKLS